MQCFRTLDLVIRKERLTGRSHNFTDALHLLAASQTQISFRNDCFRFDELYLFFAL